MDARASTMDVLLIGPEKRSLACIVKLAHGEYHARSRNLSRYNSSDFYAG